MKITQKALITAGACLAIGATAGIVGSAASPKTSSSGAAKGTKPPRLFRHDFRGGPGMFGGGMAVHGTRVVLNKKGDGFITVTEDSGTVKSVSGSDVTIAEAVGKVTYKDATVTLPSGATIYRNGKKATASDLKAGDVIHVSSSSEGTNVFAGDKSAMPFGGRGGPGPGGRGPGGPGPRGPGGPPGLGQHGMQTGPPPAA